MKRTKFATALCLLSVALLLAIFALPTKAEVAIVESGTCGADLTWILGSDGTLTISGTGNMYNYSTNTAPWCNASVAVKQVIIEEDVTSIGNNAFAHCSSLTSVTIGDSVTSIGKSAFNACTSLIDVYVTDPNAWCKISFASEAANPMYNGEHLHILDADGNEVMELVLDNTVTVIPDRAFLGSVLTSVTIPDSVESIGNCAFSNCDSLTGIWVDENNTYYCNDSYGVLFNEDKTTLIQAPAKGVSGSYLIPESVTDIGDRAFSSCSDLTYNIYDNAKYLGNANNPYVILIASTKKSITACSIHPDTKIITWRAFYNCTSLASVTIPNSVTSIANYAFAWCGSLTSVTIGDSVTTIGDHAFYHCDSLTSVTVPDSVTSLGGCSFIDCTSLTSVTIGNGLTSIAYNAFYRCDGLICVTIPDSVTSIEAGVFNSCISLADVYYAGTESQWNAIDIGSNNSTLDDATIYYNHPAHDYAADFTTCGNCGYVRADVAITNVVLRPACSGLYFKGGFTFGAQETVNRYGIAVSLYNKLPMADDSDETSLYTIGNNSVLISNILTGDNDKSGKKLIYARPYALLGDGTYIYGNVVCTNLKSVVEAIDAQFSNLTTAQKEAIAVLYRQNTATMQSWPIPQIKEFAV